MRNLLYFLLFLVLLGPLTSFAQAEDDLEAELDRPEPPAQPSKPQKPTADHSQPAGDKQKKQEAIKKRTKKTASNSNDYRWTFTVGAGYSTAEKANFTAISMSAPASVNIGNGEFQSSAAMMLSAGVIFSKANAFGAYANYVYQLERKIKSYSLAGGSSGTYGSQQPAFQVSLLELGGLYRWSEFYLPFGFNSSVISYKDINDGTGVSTTFANGIGMQAGVGYFWMKEFTSELLFQTIGVSAKATGTNYSLDYGKGTISGLSLHAKYCF